MIKEETQTRENIKKLGVETIEMIIGDENLRLENEESLLKLINELYKEDRKYSILYEYVEFCNILETSIKFDTIYNESNCKKSNNDSSSNKDQINYANCENRDKSKDNNQAKVEMRKFFEIFDINDLNISLWNHLFNKFIFLMKNSNDFSNHLTNSKEVEKGVGEDGEENEAINKNKKNYNRYQIKKKYNIVKIEEIKELNGILRYLTNETKGNIHDNGTINITTNSICGNDNNSFHPKYLVDFNDTKYYYSKNEENIYICFDFRDKQIKISQYQIKSYRQCANGNHLKNWIIEISNDGKKWEEIDRRKDCRTLNGERIIGTFEIEKQQHFGRFVRLVQTGNNWYNYKYVIIYNIEFYGEIKETKK